MTSIWFIPIPLNSPNGPFTYRLHGPARRTVFLTVNGIQVVPHGSGGLSSTRLWAGLRWPFWDGQLLV